MLQTKVEIKSSKRYQNSNDKSREIIKSRHAKDMFHLKIALSTKEYFKYCCAYVC